MCAHLLALTFMSNVSFIQFHFSPKGRPHKKEFWLHASLQGLYFAQQYQYNYTIDENNIN